MSHVEAQEIEEIKQRCSVQPFRQHCVPFIGTESCPLRALFICHRIRLYLRPPLGLTYDFIKLLPQDGNISYGFCWV